jgi:hypothetical protein
MVSRLSEIRTFLLCAKEKQSGAKALTMYKKEGSRRAEKIEIYRAETGMGGVLRAFVSEGEDHEDRSLALLSDGID